MVTKFNKFINRETFLYTFFGILTTILNIISYELLLDFSVPYMYSNLFALIITKIVAYLVNKFFVFHSKTKNLSALLKELWRYTLARGFTMLIDYFSLILFVEVFLLNKSISKYITTLLVLIINYILSKKKVFTDK